MEAKAFPMNGGDGAYSYTKNSQYQRASLNAAKDMIKEAIAENFDITCLNSDTIRMADLGCSVGPNTFIAMQNVLEAMVDSNQTSKEFQVFFSDHVSNDFNTLFASLPPDRHYFAAGVPGSFHGRLFPKSSLHLVHSSYALQWLSEVPEELLDKSSVAWNKGRINYTSASEQVATAYATQFAKDMDIFFSSRADEIAAGGIMILIMPALPDEVHHSKLPAGVLFRFLEQSLTEMVKAGSITEAQVDAFNLPVYAPTPTEMTRLVERNGCFKIERIELIDPRAKFDGPLDITALIMHIRAGFEGILTKHFGSEIIDELFERTMNKSAEISIQIEASYSKGTQLFLVLKRK
ncbi:hypothetical protein RHGRI_011871 [Rhododendron griersonianum]|uniref:S-adenosylmethionine-dependent methyltransferase n=1 Tax=Rhododendron griersonianum TaxID=479676 RepID=A0AAV6KPU2_9ERIC|nr:hypothetical protein RHGRI_011871 [Rhododendron griersonianum]KAG5554139.1 hypothetical protein RHGRI_011871 [Rhododendron griersonianum]KAG5554140.1 hypothetical protein RHGRI_011871 [Rhododendron griersonianum]